MPPRFFTSIRWPFPGRWGGSGQGRFAVILHSDCCVSPRDWDNGVSPEENQVCILQPCESSRQRWHAIWRERTGHLLLRKCVTESSGSLHIVHISWGLVVRARQCGPIWAGGVVTCVGAVTFSDPVKPSVFFALKIRMGGQASSPPSLLLLNFGWTKKKIPLMNRSLLVMIREKA